MTIDAEYIRNNLEYFMHIPQNNVGSRLVSIGYDSRCKVIVTTWIDGAFIVYFGNPPKTLMDKCIENRSGKLIYHCGFPYVVFKD